MFGIGLMEILIIFGMLLIIAVSVVIPIILIAKSDRVSGSSKLLWIIITLFTSWLGLIIFLVVNQKKQY